MAGAGDLVPFAGVTDGASKVSARSQVRIEFAVGSPQEKGGLGAEEEGSS
jgi:hypothetical protein